MKNAPKQICIAIVIIAIVIIAGITACNNDTPDNPDTPTGQQPQKQPDTPRSLSFPTTENPNNTCTVTIKSDDQFTASEWKTLCDKVVAAIGRGYDATPNPTKPSTATYFANNTVSAVFLKSATYDVEVKNTVPKTMYFKANASTIDGISGENMFSAIGAMKTGGSYPTP